MRVKAFKALYPNLDVIDSPDTFFDSAGKDFPLHYQSGLFKSISEKCVFIYSISNQSKRYSGLINNTSIQDLIEGKILFHEDTITLKEEDMVNYSLERNAMVKPVLLFHESCSNLNKFIQEMSEKLDSFLEFQLNDGSFHTFWKIDDKLAIHGLQKIFEEEISHAYIADGHHRSSSTLKLYNHFAKQNIHHKFENMLTAYFDQEQMEIFDHIKITSILDTLNPDIFLAKLSDFADIIQIENFQKPLHHFEFILIIENQNYKAAWKKDVIKEFEKKNEKLDTFISNQIIFNHILAIPDVRIDKRISFYSGKESEENILNHCLQIKNSITLCQFPPSVTDIISVADEKRILPPKSTWFEPRIKSGMIAQKY